MPAPNIAINLFDLSVYSPQVSEAIVGCVGPATKGPVNTLTDITDEGTFTTKFGVPPDANLYAPRAGIRYLKGGNKLKFVRIAGPNLQTATLLLKADDGRTGVLLLSGVSSGSWANGALKASVVWNGTSSYDIVIYFSGQPVEEYRNLDNGIVVSKINNTSTRVRVALVSGAGTTFPAQTINPVTGGLDKRAFTGGDDGAFAKTDSSFSSTAGIAGKRFYGKMDVVAGSRVFQNLLTIGAAQAGLATIRGTTGTPVAPGTFTIRVQTAAGPTFIELADNGKSGYGPGAGGLGFLIPSAGAHVGFVDYRTGSWGVKLVGGATTFLTGTVDAIWIRANAESAGATAKGVGAYAGNLSAGPIGVGFFNQNRFIMTVPVSEIAGVPTGGATSASSEAGLKTLAGWSVPGSVTLTPGHPTLTFPAPVYDDGFGGWRTGPNGTGTPVTGTLDYRTGVYSVTWPITGPTMPASGLLAADYASQLIDMGAGSVPGPAPGVFETLVISTSAVGGATATSADAGSIPLTLPIFPGSVKVVFSDVAGSPFTVWDDGVGGWLSRPRGDPRAVAVTGTINYATGAWSITPGAAITAASTITAFYTLAAFERSRRALRGTGPQFLANAAANAAGLDLSNPATADSFNGQNWLDHVTGQFAFKLSLITTGAATFDLADGGTLTAVYVPASILGYGDGTAVTFTGQLAPAPFRRQNNRLIGFQGAESSAAGSGDPQVTFAKLGATPTADFWVQNVALATDPANALDFRTGVASIKWVSAPLLDESVFVVAEETVLNARCLYPGDIGNERAVLTDGLFVTLDADPTLAGSLRFRVSFGTEVVESFGQALGLDELVAKVNDPTNGSTFVRVSETDASSFLAPDVSAAQNSGLAGAFTLADVIGTKIGQVYTGLQLFQNEENVAVNFIMIPGQWHRQVITALQTLCERKRRRCMGIVPIPDEVDPFEHRNFVNGYYITGPGGTATATARVPYPPLTAIDSSQLAVVGPWVGYFDAYANVNVFEPMDGDVGELVATTPQPWFPIAGERRGGVNADTVRYSASQDDRDLLYGPVGNETEILNLVVAVEGQGLQLTGQRTAQRAPTSLDRINVRWTINVLMNLLSLQARRFLFELNDPILWREATAEINSLLKPIIERRGLRDAYVVIDQTTNPSELVDQLQMNGNLFVKPPLAVEYINFGLILTPSGADFASIVVG